MATSKIRIVDSARIYTGMLDLVAQFPSWRKLPLREMIRSIYVLQENWENWFVTGSRNNQVLSQILGEELEEFQKLVTYVVGQASLKKGRVFLYKRESEFRQKLSEALRSLGYTGQEERMKLEELLK